MKNKFVYLNRIPSLVIAVITTLTLISTLTATGPNTKETQQDACSRTSLDALNSCRTSAQSAYSLSLGNCDNIPDPAQRGQCHQDAQATLQVALQTCQDQFVARQQLCGLLGGGPYNPVIDPANFGGPIDNPYFPLIPGRTLIYEVLPSRYGINVHHMRMADAISNNG